MDAGGRIMAEYINREAIMKFPIRKDHCDKEHANGHFINGIESVLEYVENLPSADVAPVRHGRWEKQSGLYSCSECGMTCPYDVQADVIEYWACNFCPNCGAKMEGESI